MSASICQVPDHHPFSDPKIKIYVLIDNKLVTHKMRKRNKKSKIPTPY
jgi:hypothetical protein